MKLRLAAPKRYRLREAGGSLILTIPSVAMLHVTFKRTSSLWLHVTPDGDLLLSNKKKA
jgi:antitoxin component of MazEF toxin-antitoxin module